MVQDSPSRRQDQFVLRMPDGMRDQLKVAAEQSQRSMNAEIVARLQKSLAFDAAAAEEDPRHGQIIRQIALAMQAAYEVASDTQDAFLNVHFTIEKPDGSTIKLGPKVHREDPEGAN